MLHDLRLAARTLLKDRAFTIAAVTTLALGIAACTVVFTTRLVSPSQEQRRECVPT